MVSIKNTKDAKDVIAQLYAYFKQAIRTLDILKVILWNTLYLLHNIKYLNDFLLNFLILILKKIIKVCFICNNLSVFHTAKVIYKLHICKF